MRTTYLLRYLGESDLRAAVRRQLSRVEGRHALAAHLFHAQRGAFATGEIDQLSAKATALSVPSNVALCWTSVQFARVCAEIAPGEPLPLELLLRIALKSGHGLILAQAIVTWLRDEKIVIPSVDVIDRLGSEVRGEAEQMTFDRLLDGLSPMQLSGLGHHPHAPSRRGLPVTMCNITSANARSDIAQLTCSSGLPLLSLR